MILSLFPGFGLLDMAFEAEGFCIVRGPDLLWGGDIHHFHPPAGVFEGVIGGPPCQRFSVLQRMNIARGKSLPPNLIPEFERCVYECQPDWFLMENVPDAPPAVVAGYDVQSFLFNNHWLDEDQSRIRRWCWGVRSSSDVPRKLEIEIPALHRIDKEPTVTRRATKWENRPGRKPQPRSTISWKHLRESCRLQGLPEDLFDRVTPRPFTVEGAQAMIGNGVPLPMGKAMAKAILALYREREGTQRDLALEKT